MNTSPVDHPDVDIGSKPISQPPNTTSVCLFVYIYGPAYDVHCRNNLQSFNLYCNRTLLLKLYVIYYLIQGGYVFICEFVSRIVLKLLDRFSQNSVER